MTAHLPRLGHALRDLLRTRRTAALATRDTASGVAFASMVPFAVDPVAPCVVVHVSALAAHTGNMAAEPRVTLLVTAPEQPDAPVHNLQRVTLEALASTPTQGSAAWHSARHAYMARFPDAALIAELPDFRFVTLALTGARQIAGFGSARSVSADELALVLAGD